MDVIIYYFPYFAIVVIALLLLAKVVLFVKFRSRKSSFSELIYVSQRNIMLSSSSKRQSIKKLQNLLSILILVLAILYLLDRFLFLKR